MLFKNNKNRFWASCWGLRGNERTPTITRWKARDRLPIRHNWTFFAISYDWDVISGNLSTSACLEGGGWAQLQTRWGVVRQPWSANHDCWYQKTRVIALSCGVKISAVHYLVLSQSTHVADGQTELRLPRPHWRSCSPVKIHRISTEMLYFPKKIKIFQGKGYPTSRLLWTPLTFRPTSPQWNLGCASEKSKAVSSVSLST